MKRLTVKHRINELVAQFYAQITQAGKLSLTDANKVAEDVLIPVFEIVYGYSNLQNLNDSEYSNCPAIDLADPEAKVAIQVTSTPTSQKVKDTLSKFVEHGLHEDYHHLIVYILSEKQNSYSGRGFDDIIQGRFQFNKDQDIRDHNDLIEAIDVLDFNEMYRVKEVLETHFGEGKRLLELPHARSKSEDEAVTLNLVEIDFPDRLFLANTAFDRKETIRHSREDPDSPSLPNYAPPRKVAKAALGQRGQFFSQDWHAHAGLIITFHDLNDSSLPLTKIVEPGTVVDLPPESWYERGEDHERVFNYLLSRCLSQMLYKKGIVYQYQERVHMYGHHEDDKLDAREERWVGERENWRKVYKPTESPDESGELWHAQHLAFNSRFRRFGERWFLSIKPEWFFSYNGYKRYSKHGDKVDYLKKNERNQDVFNHLRFLEYQLKHEKPSSLFDREVREPYPFLIFGNLVTLDGHPTVPDSEWRSMETPEEKDRLENENGASEDEAQIQKTLSFEKQDNNER